MRVHLLLFSILGAAVCQQYSCPSFVDLPYEGEKCFFFSDKPNQFSSDLPTAIKQCHTYGGSLASITSRAQNDFIIKKKDKTKTYRIGLLRASNHWMDGSILDFYPLPRETHQANANYPEAVMTEEGGWTYVNAQGMFGFICSVVVRPLPASLAPSICPYGGQVVFAIQSSGYSGCPEGFTGNPTATTPGTCCVVCPRGGVHTYASANRTCPSGYYLTPVNYCCPN